MQSWMKRQHLTVVDESTAAAVAGRKQRSPFVVRNQRDSRCHGEHRGASCGVLPRRDGCRAACQFLRGLLDCAVHGCLAGTAIVPHSEDADIGQLNLDIPTHSSMLTRC